MRNNFGILENFMKLKTTIPFLGLLVLLSGCASTVEPDGYSQAAVISGTGGVYKVGKPYKIMGKTYYPKEDYDYSEVGIASWYGSDFHNKKTANGERYDMNTLTAAHRTLPLPSIVKVTNLENGRSLVLRVNDRGPYAKNRIIDISKRGAQLLGFQTKGTAKVRVELMENESKEPKAALTGQKVEPVMASTKKSTPIKKMEYTAVEPLRLDNPYNAAGGVTAEKSYFVQAGSFAQHDAAKDLSSKLSRFGESKVAQADVDGSRYYRVRIGPFSFPEEAEVTLAKVKNYGIYNAKIVQD